MKKRIIGLLLVLVLAASTFTGCAFNYQKKDMSKYASVKADAIASALAAIQIEDGDFKDEGTNRAEKVQAQIDAVLVAAAKTKGDFKTEGTTVKKNVVNYSYYATIKDDTTGAILYVDKFAEAKATQLFLDAKEADTDLDSKIEAAVIGKDFAAIQYKTKTSGTVAEGDIAYITYTRQETISGETVKITATSERVTITAANAFTKAILDLGAEDETKAAKIGTKFASSTGSYINVTEGEGEGARSVTYSDVTINWVVEKEPANPIVVEHSPFTKETKVTDSHGVEHTLNDETVLEYHIYPVNFYEIEKFDKEAADETAKVVLFAIFGNKITTTSLAIFTEKNEDGTAKYKYTDTDGKTVTLEDIIKTLVADYKAISDAETALSKATDAEKAEKEAALEELKTKIDRDTVFAKIDKCGTDMRKVITDAYYDAQFDQLENAYNSEIKDNLAHEVWKAFSANVTVNEAPEKAVKDAYKRNLESYKYTYYTGSDSSKKAYKDTYKTFKDYLREVVAKDLNGNVAVADNAAAEALLRKEAEAQVKEIVLFYAVLQYVNETYDQKFEVKRAEIESYAYNQALIYYFYYQMSIDQDSFIKMYGEENIRTGLLMEKMMNFMLETEEDQPLKYTHLTYTFKTTD